jgi:hypothetical protein
MDLLPKKNNALCGKSTMTIQKPLGPPKEKLLKKYNRFLLKDYRVCPHILKKELTTEEMEISSHDFLCHDYFQVLKIIMT